MLCVQSISKSMGNITIKAGMGPAYCFKMAICNCNVKTARERMQTEHGLHPCYATVAGDVALVLVYPSGFTLTIKLHHVLFNKMLSLKIACFILWPFDIFQRFIWPPGTKKFPTPGLKVQNLVARMSIRSSCYWFLIAGVRRDV